MAGSLNSTIDNLDHGDNIPKTVPAGEQQDDHKGQVLPFMSLCLVIFQY